MLGYGYEGYRLWVEDSQKVIHARNVIFDEQSRQINQTMTVLRENEIKEVKSQATNQNH